MKLGRLLSVLLMVSLLFSVNSFAQRKKVNINFKDLEISNFIKLTSKILHKNILLTAPIKGKVDFISSKEVYEDELLDLVQSILASKGYTLVENKAFMEVVRLSEASKHNLPIVKSGQNYKQMITKSILFHNADVNTVAAKIRHLISKSAKLVTVNENNSMLITDFPKNIQTIEKVTKEIEQNKEKQVAFIKLENIKVQTAFAQISKILKDMFNPKIAEEKVTMIPNQDSNSLVMVGYKKSLDKLKSMIKKFDQKDSKLKQQVRIISLKNTEAKNTFKAVQFVVKSKKYTSKEATPVVSVDTDTNSIIVLGPKESIDDIEKIVRELDKEKPQVYVKAKIIEVNEDLTNKIGMQYGLEAGGVSGSGLFNIATALGGGSSVVATTLADKVDLSSNIQSGLVLGATIDFLKENEAVNIVSQPSLLCINNKVSSIYVGETKSIQTGTETTSGGNTINKYSRNDIGLTLKIKPLISNDDKVTLDITTILEDVKEGSSTNGQPDTSKREIKTVALVRDGENVIIGGLIKDKIDETKQKVPLLGDIPLFGELFKHKNNVDTKVNLVIILTPYIVNTSSDLTTLRKKLTKLSAIESKVHENIKEYLKTKEKNVKH
jgi:general secretion pathway protein D